MYQLSWGDVVVMWVKLQVFRLRLLLAGREEKK